MDGLCEDGDDDGLYHFHVKYQHTALHLVSIYLKANMSIKPYLKERAFL